MASPTKYEDVHRLLLEKHYTVQGIVDSLKMSRVTVTNILKNSPDIVEHMTWPRTYALTPDSKYHKAGRREVVLTQAEKTEAQRYLEVLLKPETSIDLAIQFQSVDSVEGADALIKALLDCIKVAEYYKTVLRD